MASGGGGLARALAAASGSAAPASFDFPARTSAPAATAPCLRKLFRDISIGSPLLARATAGADNTRWRRKGETHADHPRDRGDALGKGGSCPRRHHADPLLRGQPPTRGLRRIRESLRSRQPVAALPARRGLWLAPLFHRRGGCWPGAPPP